MQDLDQKRPWFPTVFGRPVRIALVTGHDSNYTDLAALTSPNQKLYCQKNGYDFHLETGWGDNNRPQAWNKILYLKKHLPTYDWAFWCDTDVLIMDGTQKLEYFLEDWADSKDLIIPRDSRPQKDNFNTGTFFIRNCRWSLEFLDRVWAQERFIHHPYWEQAACQYVYDMDSSVHDHFRIVPRHWFGAPYDEYHEGDFLIHFSVGRGREQMKEFAARARP